MTNEQIAIQDLLVATDHMNPSWLNYLLEKDTATGRIRIDLVLAGEKMDNGDNLELLSKFFRKIKWA